MLELRHVSFSVPDENGTKNTKEILKDINLVIDEQKFVVITGPNGGGKSTLAKLISSSLPARTAAANRRWLN